MPPTDSRRARYTRTEFRRDGNPAVGRQSQTWVRFPDAGWKVIAAHVSTMDNKPLW